MSDSFDEMAKSLVRTWLSKREPEGFTETDLIAHALREAHNKALETASDALLSESKLYDEATPARRALIRVTYIIRNLKVST